MTVPSITETLIKVATSTSVDVVSQRSINPEIRAAGQAYRVFSIIEPATRIAQAFRVAAYSDVVGILAYEIIVEVATKKISNAFGSLETVNYALHQKAGEYLLEPDFAYPPLVDTHVLAPYKFDPDFAVQEARQMGGPLVQLGHDCIVRGIRAHSVVIDLLTYPETSKQRKYRNWDRKPNILDKINETSGFVFWNPAPEVGLGSGRITNQSVYRGVFRRDQPEGYGQVLKDNGEQWFGQVRNYLPTNYGLTKYPDGRIFIGYVPRHAPHLGVSISTEKNKIVFGAHGYDGTPDGWARQIGIAHGIDSRSGFWTRGELTHPIDFEDETFKQIAVKSFKKFPVERAEYLRKSRIAAVRKIINDDLIVSTVRAFL